MRRLILVLASITLGCQASDSADDPGMAEPPPLTGDKYELTWGPVTVQPHIENTQCVVLKLSNATDIKVHQMHNVLVKQSHHLIVYKDDMDTAEITTPYSCQPFTGALNLTGMVAPIMITQKDDDELTLPDGVAYTLKANQMIRIEMHYLNPGDDPIQMQATVEFYAADPETIRDEANILFIGTPDISLPPLQQTIVHEVFTPAIANLHLDSAKFFAITGHTHQLGRDVQVNIVDPHTDTMTPVYHPQHFLWGEPETVTHSPEFMVPQGGGFDFSCDYYNNTPNPVKFGESVNNEMCFFWAYYYPSNGSHVCVHSNRLGNIDVCCPGNGLCSLLENL
jgi:hypothetical protein